MARRYRQGALPLTAPGAKGKALDVRGFPPFFQSLGMERLYSFRVVLYVTSDWTVNLSPKLPPVRSRIFLTWHKARKQSARQVNDSCFSRKSELQTSPLTFFRTSYIQLLIVFEDANLLVFFNSMRGLPES